MSRAAPLRVQVGPGMVELTRLPGGRLRLELELEASPGVKTRLTMEDDFAVELASAILRTLKVRQQLAHDGECECVECECDCHIDGEHIDGETDDHREKNCECHRCECVCHFDSDRGGSRLA